MNTKTLLPITRSLAEIIFVAILYYLTARLGFLMALPPGNVTALWPPSGLALAGTLIFGWHTGIGIFAGSLLVNWGSMNGPSALPVAAAIAGGSTLQAWVAMWLLKRLVKNLPPDTSRDTLLSIGSIALTTVLAPTIGVTSLCVAGFAPWSNYLLLFETWWLGDFIGILVFTPSLIVLSLRWHKQKINELFLWPLTCFVIGVALFAFLVIGTFEQQQAHNDMQRDEIEMTQILRDAIERDIQSLVAIGAFHMSSQNVERAEFTTFTAPLLARSSATSGLSWVPRVTQAERLAYEKSIQEKGIAGFHIYEKDANGSNVLAAERAEYFPITLIEPIAANQVAVGYDIGSDRVRLKTILQARDSGEPAATPPIHLVQETGTQVGILIMVPVYQNGAPTHTQGDRRVNLVGLANGVYRVKDSVENALVGTNHSDVELYLYDISDPDNPQFLTFYPSRSGPQSLPAAGAPDPTALQVATYSTEIFKIANRDWLVVARPGPAYVLNANWWAKWVSLLVGLGLAGVFLFYVHNRQRIETILTHSEAEFRSLADNALTGIVRMKRSGDILYANEALAQMLGFETTQNLIHQNIRFYIKDLVEFDLLLQTDLPSDRARNQELDIVAPQGEKRHWLYSATLQEGLITATIVDITDRKQAALLQETVYRIAEAAQVTESLQDLYSQIHRHISNVMYADNFYIALYDETNDLLRFVYWVDEKDPHNTDPVPVGQGLTAHLLRSGKSIFFSPEREIPEVEILGTPPKVWVGVPLIVRTRTIGVMVVQHYSDADIFTEREQHILEFVSSQVATAIDRKLASEMLQKSQASLEALNRDLERRVEERTAQVRQSEATYRALFENSNDGIFLLSPQGEELRANQQALDIIGYTLEDYQTFMKFNVSVIALAEQDPDFDAHFQAVLHGEHVPLYERIFIKKDGTKINVEVNLSAVRDANGNVILVQSVVRDITERKKAEEALRESRDQLSAANAALEKASRLKDEFLASMSHELRTPLTGILGLSEMLQLQTYGALSEKQIKALKNIESSGRHLLDLINDILDLSKIEAGKLDMQFASCSVVDICHASLQLVKGMAQQKKQSVSFSIPPDSIHVRADARRLKQMLVNLLSNAIKFTPEGGLLGLEILPHKEDKTISFSVWDKGIGIKPEDLGRLFKPFVQLDSNLARQYSGTGLGLSLVQRMAELHGGSISVESVPAEGSRFTILLPWSAGITQPLHELIRHSPAVLKNALIIEDNPLDAERITQYLREIGVANFIQPMIRGAVEKAVFLHPSAILLDLHLPDGFGLDLLAQLKADERTRSIPVIITSVQEQRSEAMQLGAIGYLVKPFTQQDLYAELAKVAAFVHPTGPMAVIGTPASAPLVMMADDNELILETLTDFLKSGGYQVVATRSGAELLNRVSEVHPDIILMDVQMPGMDGIETIRRVRAHPDPIIASTPMIAVTALAMTGDREKCLQAGANEYMSKPIILTQLVEQINRFLNKR